MRVVIEGVFMLLLAPTTRLDHGRKTARGLSQGLSGHSIVVVRGFNARKFNDEPCSEDEGLSKRTLQVGLICCHFIEIQVVYTTHMSCASY